MTAFVYPWGKNAMLRAGIDWVSSNIRVAIVDTELYTPDKAHKSLDKIPPNAIVVSTQLEERTLRVNEAHAQNVYISTVTQGKIGGVVVYVDGGTPKESTLILFTDEVDGFPFTANGSDLEVLWPNGVVFTL